MDALIRQAIAEKKFVEFHYQGYTRIRALPSRTSMAATVAVKQLLVYQVRGGSKSGRLPNWRRVDLPEVSGLHILNETFPGRRANPSGEHSSWDETFAIVS